MLGPNGLDFAVGLHLPPHAGTPCVGGAPGRRLALLELERGDRAGLGALHGECMGTASLEPGRPVGGRYTIVAPIAEGGLGTVWEARDEALGRPVALKITRPEIRVTPSQLVRIEREARVAAGLDHPNVVRVLDYGVDLALGPYIAMELLRGRTLEDRIVESGTLRLREILEWLEPTARALDAIHAAGLAHRDVKPTNIMRHANGNGGIVKLLDFGIASYLDGRERLTRRGLVVGTPEYMAPEVAEGELASPASDVYSLAVIAFECLTGRLPHDDGAAQGEDDDARSQPRRDDRSHVLAARGGSARRRARARPEPAHQESHGVHGRADRLLPLTSSRRPAGGRLAVRGNEPGSQAKAAPTEAQQCWRTADISRPMLSGLWITAAASSSSLRTFAPAVITTTGMSDALASFCCSARNA